MCCKYSYWNSPKHSGKYKELLDSEKIEQHDELKTKLREKSGQYAYILGNVVTSISILVFSILGNLDIVENYRVIVLYLGAYLAVQVITGFVFYKRFLKKYQ